MASEYVHTGWRGARRPPPALPLFLLQPLCARVARTIARTHPELFARLGAHQASRFLIEPADLPFVLYLRPDARNPVLQILPRRARPVCDARITAPFLQLLRLVDGELDGDALFFSRDLTVSGNTEAVVSLRNAIDDMDLSLAASAADAFGPPGRAALALLRRIARRRAR